MTEKRPTVLMLLTNAYLPDPRVQQEALALLRLGCDVRILAWDRDLSAPAFQCMEGVEVERLFIASSHGRGTTQLLFYALLYLRMLWRGWRRSFDVVHCHDLDTLPVGFLLGKLKRKPVVYDAHESFPDMLHGSVHPLIRRALVLFENVLIRRIDLLITVGEKLRRNFADRGARRSVVIGNWKQLKDYTRTTEQNLEARTRLGIPHQAIVIVYITNLLKDRKVEELLGAIDECADMYAVIGGAGALEDVVCDRAAKNGRIIYVGFVRGADIATYTCMGDIVYYGFDPDNPNARYSAPNKLFEALAAGRPLITGAFGEIGDVVAREGCGRVIPDYTVEHVASALSSLRDESLRRTMAEKAKRLGAVMNWDRAEELICREYSALTHTRLNLPRRQTPVPDGAGPFGETCPEVEVV